MNLTVIIGTNRRGSVSNKVASAILRRYKGMDGVDAQLLDLAELPVELLSPDAYAKKPASFKPFSDRVLASDGLHIVVPEYNGGAPGALKLFIDHLPFPQSFEKRPVCFTGIANGRFGALRPVEQLQRIFGYRNAFQFPERVFISAVGRSIDDTGWPIDPPVSELMEKQIHGFVAFCRTVKPLRGST